MTDVAVSAEAVEAAKPVGLQPEPSATGRPASRSTGLKLTGAAGLLQQLTRKVLEFCPQG